MQKKNRPDFLSSRLLVVAVLMLQAVWAHAAELSAEMRAGYGNSDNIFLSPTNPTSDSIWTAGMSLGLLEETRKVLADIQAVADYLDYQDTFDSEVIGAVDFLSLCELGVA